MDGIHGWEGSVSHCEERRRLQLLTVAAIFILCERRFPVGAKAAIEISLAIVPYNERLEPLLPFNNPDLCPNEVA